MSTPISKQTLSSFIRDNGIEARCPGDCYALPTLTWITKPFAPFLSELQMAHGMKRYVDLVNVCVHYTRHAAVVASLCNLHTPTSNGKLAFGFIDFDKPDGTAHSVNIAVCRDSDMNLFIVYFEPQTLSLTTAVWKENTVPFAEV